MRGDLAVAVHLRAVADAGVDADLAVAADLRADADDRTLGEVDIAAQYRGGADDGAVLDPASGADVGALTDLHVRLDVCVGVDEGGGVDGSADRDHAASVGVATVAQRLAAAVLDLLDDSAHVIPSAAPLMPGARLGEWARNPLSQLQRECLVSHSPPSDHTATRRAARA